MSNFDHDDLPQDLSGLGRRLRDERPVAEDDALDRMMARAQPASRRSPRRAPRRAFAVSLATMLAMVSVTGVAAAALFGMSFGSIGNSFKGSTSQVGSASNQVLRAPAIPTNARRPASSIGSALGGLGSLAGPRPPAPGPAAAAPAGPSANLLPGLGNAGNAQYGARRLVCRILRALGLNFVARLLGC
jgi:hypothetical protein